MERSIKKRSITLHQGSAELSVCHGPPSPEGTVGHFLGDDPFEQFEHPVRLRFLPVEGFPYLVVQFPKTLGAHMFRWEDDLVAGIVVPFVGQNPPLPLQVREGPRVGEGGQDSELRQVQFYLQDEIDEAVDIVLCVVVEVQEVSPFSSQDGSKSFHFRSLEGMRTLLATNRAKVRVLRQKSNQGLK